jgi:hypothetical protein
LSAKPDRLNYGLSFLGVLAFTVAFFAARIFTTINPDTVIVSGGIRFHHFWFGLAMVVTAGWLGIASYHPALRRLYAVVFGFGGGLIGDEVGLLLTFGNYESQLTYVFFVGFISFATLAILVVRFRAQLERDVFSMERGEVVVHVGTAIICSSALPFAFDLLLPASALALLGVAILAAGVLSRRRAHDSVASG